MQDVSCFLFGGEGKGEGEEAKKRERREMRDEG